MRDLEEVRGQFNCRSCFCCTRILLVALCATLVLEYLVIYG